MDVVLRRADAGERELLSRLLSEYLLEFAGRPRPTNTSMSTGTRTTACRSSSKLRHRSSGSALSEFVGATGRSPSSPSSPSNVEMELAAQPWRLSSCGQMALERTTSRRRFRSARVGWWVDP